MVSMKCVDMVMMLVASVASDYPLPDREFKGTLKGAMLMARLFKDNPELMYEATTSDGYPFSEPGVRESLDDILGGIEEIVEMNREDGSKNRGTTKGDGGYDLRASGLSL